MSKRPYHLDVKMQPTMGTCITKLPRSGYSSSVEHLETLEPSSHGNGQHMEEKLDKIQM